MEFDIPDMSEMGPFNDPGAYQLGSEFDQFLVPEVMGPMPEGDPSYELPESFQQYLMPDVPAPQRTEPQGVLSSPFVGPQQGQQPLGQEFRQYEVSLGDKLMRGLGIQDKNGNFDISNPKTLDAMMKLILGGGTAINALLGGSKAKGYASASDLRAQVAGPYDKFNPTQQQWASNYFNNASTPRTAVYAADMPTSVRRGYAHGGQVGALSMAAEPLRGHGGGQDDVVPIDAAPGEYVWDADTVAAVGDGSSDHGARILDGLRQNLRAFKRAAPPDEIPPPTGDVTRFMPRGALSMGGNDGRA